MARRDHQLWAAIGGRAKRENGIVMHHHKLNQQICDRLLSYDPETGTLRWKERERMFFPTDMHWLSWNAQNAGGEAFTSVTNNGYRTGAIFHRNYLAHRVIWLLCYGKWPTGEIDHINGDRSDNRLVNLRDVTAAVNSLNKCILSNNTSGVVGVMLFKATGRWQAQIKKGGIKIHLGYFKDFEDAVNARRTAEMKLGFHPNHGRPKRAHNEGRRLI